MDFKFDAILSCFIFAYMDLSRANIDINSEFMVRFKRLWKYAQELERNSIRRDYGH